MKIELCKRKDINQNDTLNFESIKMIVLYRMENFKYLPKSLDGIVDDINEEDYIFYKVLYHGTTKNIDFVDFAEYDFKYLLEKNKFNNTQIINYLDNQSKLLIGTNVNDLDRLSSIILPTNSDKDSSVEKSVYDYFGTLTLVNQTLFLFNIDPSVYRVELYDKVLDTNYTLSSEVNGINKGFLDSDFIKLYPDKYTQEESQSPVMIIKFGPEDTCPNNPNSMYYKGAKRPGPGIRIPNLEYSKLWDEISCSKVLWADLSSDKDIKELNLSLNSWINNENPNQNKNRFNLRNDEFHAKKNTVNIFEKIEGTDFIEDKRSGLILGNKKIDKHPILSKKLSHISIYDYSPKISYKKSEIIKYNERYWVSLVDNNQGNIPGISMEWVEKSQLENSITPRITLIMDPVVGGSTIPSKHVTIEDESKKTVSFKVIPSIGYDLVKNKDSESEESYPLYYYDANGNKTKFTDYNRIDHISNNESWVEYIITGEETDSPWETLLNSKNARLYFGFEKVTPTIKILGSFDGTQVIPYNEWDNNKATLKNCYVGDEVVTVDINSSIEADLNKKVKMVFSPSTDYYMSSGIVSYKISGKTKTREINVVDNNTIEEIVNFTTAEFIFNFESRKYVRYDLYVGYEVSDVYELVGLDTDYTTRFYSSTGFDSFDHLEITLLDNSGDPILDPIKLQEGNELESLPTSDYYYHFKLEKDNDGIYNFTTKNNKHNLKIDIYDTRR